MHEIENIYFGPDSSAEQIDAIRRRVYALEDDIFMWRELPKQTVFSVQVMGQSLHDQTKDLPSFYLIADLTKAERPSAEVREAIRNNMLDIPRLDHFCALVGKNVMLRIAAKFVLSRLRMVPWSVTKTMDETLALIAKLKKERDR